MSGPLLTVVGVDDAGHEQVCRAVPHGADPQDVLAAAGYRTVHPVRVDTRRDPHELRIVALVRADAAVGPADRPADRDADLVHAAGEIAVPRQRVAVNALVHSDRGLLLTEYSHRTNVAGRWGPPGGGIDPGESPQQALVREVHEETGQDVQVGELLGLLHAHWLGRAPGGVLEDFHLVRLLYVAQCPDPGDPFVHDVGGTTSAAAWVPPDRLAALTLAPGWAEWLGTPPSGRPVSGADG